MSKPNWKDAPKRANWLAQDSDGCWNWYPTEPRPLASIWMDRKHDWEFACHGVVIGSWKETLERRP